MSTTLKKIFAQNGATVKEITFSDDTSIITVTFNQNSEKGIFFDRVFLVDIGMSFAVKRKLNELAKNELYLELYPLGRD